MKKTDAVRQALLCMQRHSWEQGVAMQALLEMGDMEAVIQMAFEAVCRQVGDGRTAVIDADHGATDPCSVGEALLRAAQQTGDPRLREGCRSLLQWAERGAPRAADGTVYHLTDKMEMWVDSMYMLPPFLAAAGKYTEALCQIDGLYRRLHDPASGLMAHRWDEEKGQLLTVAHWGVGNGWTLAGIVRVQAMLPDTMEKEKNDLREKIRGLLAALHPLMRNDGLYHNVVDDPSTFVETNLSQMASYTVYRGCAQGWLGQALLPWADQMRRAAEDKADEWGLVRGVCGAPDFSHPGTAPEGQAFFLLMEQAYEDWKNQRGDMLL